MKNEILRFENVHCMMERRQCINGLFLDLFDAEICGIMVDNIREREYILQLLRGELSPYYGWMYYDGNKVTSKRALDLMASKIAFINASEAIYGHLSVEENIYVARRNVEWYEPVNRLCRDAQEKLDDLSLSLKCDKKGYLLGAGEAKQVELLRAFESGCRIAVISEIEQVVTDVQLESFFELVETLRGRGMSFLYFSTSTSRLFRYADRITVVKKGRTVGFVDRENFARSSLYMRLYGKKAGISEDASLRSLTPAADGHDVLRFVRMKINGLPPIDLSLKAGELLNVFDADYANFHNLVEVLEGEHLPETGHFLLKGVRYSSRNMEHAIRQGIGFIEGKSMERMLFMDLSVLDNLVIMLCCKKHKIFSRKKYRRLVLNFYGDVFTKEELDHKVYEVSDECKLKLIYYKWILVKPTVLVCVRPFASVDYHMRQLTADLLRKAAEEGIAVIIFANQFDESHTMKGKCLTIRNSEISIED